MLVVVKILLKKKLRSRWLDLVKSDAVALGGVGTKRVQASNRENWRRDCMMGPGDRFADE